MDGDGSVPGATRDGIELEVLLESLSLSRCEVESLLFMVDRQEVEGWHEEDIESERDRRQANFASMHAPVEGSGQDHGAVHVVCQSGKGSALKLRKSL